MENPSFICLKKSVIQSGKTIKIGGSKSISNRLLILQNCFGNFEIVNLSDAEDTVLLQKALSEKSNVIDVHHAGTAMRFLTSYFACQENSKIILTGSERLQQRPINDLVDALRQLGAEINYLGNKGFAPLEIIGKKITKNFVKIKASVSSQFISSLLLIAPSLDNGLALKLIGEPTSKPYLEMTIDLLKEMGIDIRWVENEIIIPPSSKKTKIPTKIVESDWSSSSYFYSLAAISRKNIFLNSFFENSLQGDSKLQEIYSTYFGIETIFLPDYQTIQLKPIADFSFPKEINLNLNDCPDIAQTICVNAVALKMNFFLTGLQTLKIKETDRLLALKNELAKIGCISQTTENSIKSLEFNEINNPIKIFTYQDHRMAMSFAPFCLVENMEIENPKVVEKSFPNFWGNLKEITKPL